MEKIIETNQIVLTGTIDSPFTYSHDIYGEGFYQTYICVARKSGTIDRLPVIVSERLIDVSKDWTGEEVKVEGQIRSYNKHTGQQTRLLLSVFARSFEPLSDDEAKKENTNTVILDGFVCKQPFLRQTPLGREISDLLIAVNRPYRKSDYIPCVCWGRNARYATGLAIGERIILKGRFQSREYLKKIDDETTEERTAYELSVQTIKEVENEVMSKEEIFDE